MNQADLTADLLDEMEEFVRQLDASVEVPQDEDLLYLLALIKSLREKYAASRAR